MNPSISITLSLPTRKPPLETVGIPLDGSEIVAYNPSPTFLTEAKPLSAIGVCETREFCGRLADRVCIGRNSAAAQSAPRYDVFVRKFRRENWREIPAFGAFFDKSIFPPYPSCGPL